MLARAGYPVIKLYVPDAYSVAAEFYRWEVAVSVACHILGLNAFDQPDVQESKDRTRAKIEDFRSNGRLDEGAWDISIQHGRLPSTASATLDFFLSQGRPGDYVAINAYVPRRQGEIDELQRIRARIREKTHLAVTAGFGPRFQHSTGQYHKGGPNTGLFIQIVTDAPKDLMIPAQGMSFGTLMRAQALGDYETLVGRGRRVLRVRLSRPEDLVVLKEALK